jgi:UDP-N-acetylglucosamine--N-acetylmuramyl-(pentapeptide) pyrophosphoryl-undecaprenol N-acetylglucosamine transferase
MKNNNKTYKFIISGGGTGGHIFPALSIADEIKKNFPESEILFVGAKNKMEMDRVPAAGYSIEGLWISGLNRTDKLKNIFFPFKLISSLWKARKIINRFKPDAVIGTGGFASGPIMYMAQMKGIPTFIQEQNSFPGITNKLLAKKSDKIYVAYNGLERFFDKDKIEITGNPVRSNLLKEKTNKEEAAHFFGLDPKKKTILVIGGSLGAMPVNRAIEKRIDEIKEQGWQLIWQTGKNHYQHFKKFEDKGIKVLPFIQDMSAAYSIADVILSRAGAGTVSELAIVGKPVILIPSPYVAEDHQTKNAQSLVNSEAAILIEEKELDNRLFEELLNLFSDTDKYKKLSDNLKKLAKPEATKEIVNDIMSTISSKNRKTS